MSTISNTFDLVHIQEAFQSLQSFVTTHTNLLNINAAKIIQLQFYAGQVVDELMQYLNIRVTKPGKQRKASIIIQELRFYLGLSLESLTRQQLIVLTRLLIEFIMLCERAYITLEILEKRESNLLQRDVLALLEPFE